MFSRTVHTNPEPQGTATTFHLEGAVAETVFEGHVSEGLLTKVTDFTPTVMRDLPSLRWLVDMTEVTGYDLGARTPGRKLASYFAANGGKHMAFAMPSPRLRMIVSAVAFAVGMRASFHATREEALAKLRTMPE